MNHLKLNDMFDGYPFLKRFECSRKRKPKHDDDDGDLETNMDNLAGHTKQSQLKGALLKNLVDEHSEIKHEAKKLRAHNKGKQKSNLDQTKMQSDPLLEYGFGINAYRFTLCSLSVLFFVASFFAGAMMYVYDQGTGYD